MLKNIRLQTSPIHYVVWGLIFIGMANNFNQLYNYFVNSGYHSPISASASQVFSSHIGWFIVIPILFYIGRYFYFSNFRNIILIYLPVGVIFSLFHLFTWGILADLFATEEVSFSRPLAERIQLSFFTSYATYLVLTFAIAATQFQSRLVKADLESSKLRAERAEMESRIARIEMETIHARLQPHFLFNAMHTLSILLHKDQKAAEKALQHLSTLLRATLRASQDPTHTLQDELDWLEGFLAFERLRFDRDVRFTVDLEAGISEIYAPSLLLQPLAENALKHAAKSKDSLDIKLIGRWTPQDRVQLCVIDNGRGLQGAPVVFGDGLRLVQERLQSEYSAAGQLTVSESPSGGVAACVEFPAKHRASAPSSAAVS